MSPRELIVKTLQEKSIMKQQLHKNSKDVFRKLKTILRNLNSDLSRDVNTTDIKLHFNFEERSDYEAVISFAGDTLIFHLHSNIFSFDKSHQMHNSSYIKEDENRAYCACINVYNFLTDSFKYNRQHDIGYLIARIFINKENMFFVEGKRQLGFLYNNFGQEELTEETLTAIIESAILYALDFDLLTPSYDQVKQVSIAEIYYNSEMFEQKTGKRLGFTFQADHIDNE